MREGERIGGAEGGTYIEGRADIIEYKDDWAFVVGFKILDAEAVEFF
jgi:hypothetical protein